MRQAAPKMTARLGVIGRVTSPGQVTVPGGLQPSVIEASTPVEDTTNDLLGYELPADAPDADVLARDIGQHSVIEQFRRDWGIPKDRTLTQQETIAMLAWYCGGSARELCGESLYMQLVIDKFEDDLAFAFSYGMIEGATAPRRPGARRVKQRDQGKGRRLVRSENGERPPNLPAGA